MHLHTLPALRSDRANLLKQSLAFEDLALDLLDAIHDSEDAEPLLCVIPWEWSPQGKRVMLSDESALDTAAQVSKTPVQMQHPRSSLLYGGLCVMRCSLCAGRRQSLPARRKPPSYTIRTGQILHWRLSWLPLVYLGISFPPRYPSASVSPLPAGHYRGGLNVCTALILVHLRCAKGSLQINIAARYAPRRSRRALNRGMSRWRATSPSAMTQTALR